MDTIINNMPAMVFYKNLEGEYIAANEMFCRQMNTTPAKIIGKTDFHFLDAKVARIYLENDRELISSGKPMEGFEEEIIVQGESRIFTTRKVLLRDHEGKPYGIVGLSYDITENHHAEQELIESRTRYKYMYNVFRLMADNIPDLLWAKDMRKHYLFTNKAMCETLLGAIDTEEPIGKTDMFFARRERTSHPEDPEWHTFGEICSDTDDRTMQQKGPGRYDEYGNVKGEYLFLDVQKAPIMDEDGNMIGTVGSGRDITKQKLMEQEFQALYQRNRAILEALPDLMFLYDADGNYLEIHSSDPSEIFDTPENIIGRNVRDYFEPALAAKTMEAIAACLQTETLQSFEYSLREGNSQKYYEARLIRVDENKVLCIARNMTVQKQLQQELLEAKEKAEESSKLKTTLLKNMSHEIRTPLNGILGFSDILIKELNDQDYVEMATLINKSGSRLLKTLDSIMQLSQLESGTKTLQSDHFDLQRDLLKIVSGFTPQADEKGLHLTLRHPPAMDGYLDALFFTQAFGNIIENAIKFTPSGEVFIDAAVSNPDGQRTLLIKVTDSGIGISEEHLKIIFDEFRQVSEGRNRNFEGTGLGLTIAVKMIRLLGGDIRVESEMGKGSVFHIMVPYPDIQDQFHEKGVSDDILLNKPVVAGIKDPGRTILMIEDDEVNAQLLIVYLKHSYQVEWATDGKKALEMLKKNTYGAVLMDLNHGKGLDGDQAIGLIREIHAVKDIPVFLLTGFTMFGNRDHFIQAGFTDYLTKPVTKSKILALLDKILPVKTSG